MSRLGVIWTLCGLPILKSQQGEIFKDVLDMGVYE